MCVCVCVAALVPRISLLIKANKSSRSMGDTHDYFCDIAATKSGKEGSCTEFVWGDVSA